MVGGCVPTVTFSVDLELELSRQDEYRRSALAAIGRRLVELFDRYHLAATFALADPAHSAAAELLAAAATPHEIAVLADEAWVGCGVSRLRLERELARRFLGARRSGIAASTLALRGREASLDPELMQNLEIIAVRGAAQNHPGPDRQTRFGVYLHPTPWRHPLAASWWRPTGWQVRWLLWRSAQPAKTLHFLLDGAAMVEAGDRSLDQVQRTLAIAAALIQAGRLTNCTIANCAQRRLRQQAALSSRSVLRAA